MHLSVGFLDVQIKSNTVQAFVKSFVRVEMSLSHLGCRLWQ